MVFHHARIFYCAYLMSMCSFLSLKYVRIEKVKYLSLAFIWFFTTQKKKSCFGLFWDIGQFANEKKCKKERVKVSSVMWHAYGFSPC